MAERQIPPATTPKAAESGVDWRSYDEIAERYDRVWSIRFEAVARQIWALMPPRTGDHLLDVGTGQSFVTQRVISFETALGR